LYVILVNIVNGCYAYLFIIAIIRIIHKFAKSKYDLM